VAKAIQDWLKRHRNPTSFWLHMLGIPACFVAAPLLAVFGQWWVAAAVFVAGYALQFIGHLIEGNRSGEEMLLRRLIAKFGKAGRRSGRAGRRKRG